MKNDERRRDYNNQHFDGADVVLIRTSISSADKKNKFFFCYIYQSFVIFILWRCSVPCSTFKELLVEMFVDSYIRYSLALHHFHPFCAVFNRSANFATAGCCLVDDTGYMLQLQQTKLKELWYVETPSHNVITWKKLDGNNYPKYAYTLYRETLNQCIQDCYLYASFYLYILNNTEMILCLITKHIVCCWFKEYYMARSITRYLELIIVINYF